jgi:hypothetical protein
MKIRYGLHIRRFIRKFLDCFYIAASAKENERGGQSHTSASVHIASVCCEHTLFFFYYYYFVSCLACQGSSTMSPSNFV